MMIYSTRKGRQGKRVIRECQYWRLYLRLCLGDVAVYQGPKGVYAACHGKAGHIAFQPAFQACLLRQVIEGYGNVRVWHGCLERTNVWRVRPDWWHKVIGSRLSLWTGQDMRLARCVHGCTDSKGDANLGPVTACLCPPPPHDDKCWKRLRQLVVYVNLDAVTRSQSDLDRRWCVCHSGAEAEGDDHRRRV